MYEVISENYSYDFKICLTDRKLHYLDVQKERLI